MKNALKSYRKVKKLPTWLYVPLALFMKFVKTFLLRKELVDPNGNISEENIPCITVTWHNRLLFYPVLWKKKYRVRTYALISPSRDGQYISDLALQFGVRSVRGSSSKKAASALHESFKVLKSGCNLSMTPDGPRGPRYRMSMGPVIMASKTGYPVLPVSVNYSRYWELKSWDKFQIPKPFAKAKLVAGEFIRVPANLEEGDMEKWRKLIEDKLNEIS